MKHIDYFSPTMNTYMISLKYDFDELKSKQLLYTACFTDSANNIQYFNDINSDLHNQMGKIIVRQIFIQSNILRTIYTDDYRKYASQILTPREACHYLQHMYYNGMLYSDNQSPLMA